MLQYSSRLERYQISTINYPHQVRYIIGMSTSVKSFVCSQIVDIFAMERFRNKMAFLFALIDLLISLNKGKVGKMIY